MHIGCQVLEMNKYIINNVSCNPRTKDDKIRLVTSSTCPNRQKQILIVQMADNMSVQIANVWGNEHSVHVPEIITQKLIPKRIRIHMIAHVATFGVSMFCKR
jgi:hypothetical protein